METIKDLAITLKVTPYDERDRIVTAITGNHGKVTVMAKNSIQSRRFGGALDLLNASQWTYSEKAGSDMGFLKEAEIRKSFESLRTDFTKLSLGSFFGEVVLRMAPHHAPCPELFKLLANALSALEEPGGENWDLKLLNLFLGKTLQWSGNHPLFESCLECLTPLTQLARNDPEMTVTALVADSGWICPNCKINSSRHLSDPHRMECSVRTLCQYLFAIQFPIRKGCLEFILNRRELENFYPYLESLLRFHISGFDQTPIKSAEFLRVKSNWQPPKDHLR